VDDSSEATAFAAIPRERTSQWTKERSVQERPASAGVARGSVLADGDGIFVVMMKHQDDGRRKALFRNGNCWDANQG